MTYAVIDSGYIAALVAADAAMPHLTALTDEQIDAVQMRMANRPAAPEGYRYMLRADTLEWELAALPPEPQEDPTAEEILDTLFGGDAT